METRRTNPSFLSDSEAIRERERTQEMVRSIIGSSPTTKTDETNKFVADKRFWKSWKGRIVRAIVLTGVYSKDEIIKTTKLKEEQFEEALEELFQSNLIEESGKDRLWVKKELWKQCNSYFEDIKEALLDWVQKWRIKNGVSSIILNGRSHFYLDDRLLSKFSESLIGQAKQEILVTSPFVRRCHISDALMLMSKKGLDVKLVTRYFDSEQFKREIHTSGVAVTYDEFIHAKLIVVDRRVGIVSSMNFYAGSSGGACWEAGIVTVERNVVNSISRSILSKV